MPTSSSDYADRFDLATDLPATPEQWARAIFGDVPSPGQVFIWRICLGLRLSRGPSPDTVAGWRIAARREDSIRLSAASWFLSADLVVRTAAGRVSLETSLHYDRWPARVLWRPLSAVHRAVVPGVLRAGAAKLTRSRLPRASHA